MASIDDLTSFITSFSVASNPSFNFFSLRISSINSALFNFRYSLSSVANLVTSSTGTSSIRPLTPAYTTATCSARFRGENWGCFNNSLSLLPLSSCCWVASSRSDANWEKAASSSNCASSNFKVPAIF